MAIDLRARRAGGYVTLDTPRGGEGVRMLLSNATRNPLQPPPRQPNADPGNYGNDNGDDTPAPENEPGSNDYPNTRIPPGLTLGGSQTQPQQGGTTVVDRLPSVGQAGQTVYVRDPYGGITPYTWDPNQYNGDGVARGGWGKPGTRIANPQGRGSGTGTAAAQENAQTSRDRLTFDQQQATARALADKAAIDYKKGQDALDRDYRASRDKIKDDRYLASWERQQKLDQLDEWYRGQQINLQRASQLGFDENGNPTLATQEALGRIGDQNTLARDLGEASSRRADVDINLRRQAQAFNEEMQQRREAIDLGANPLSYLEYAALHSGRPVDPNTTLGAALARIQATPGVEEFLNQQNQPAPAAQAGTQQASAQQPGAAPQGIDLSGLATNVLTAPRTVPGAAALDLNARASDPNVIRLNDPEWHPTPGMVLPGQEPTYRTGPAVGKPANPFGLTAAPGGFQEDVTQRTGPAVTAQPSVPWQSQPVTTGAGGATIGNAPAVNVNQPRQSGALTLDEARGLTGGTLPGGLESAYRGQNRIGQYAFRPIGGVRQLPMQTQNALSESDRLAQKGLLAATGNALGGSDADIMDINRRRGPSLGGGSTGRMAAVA